MPSSPRHVAQRQRLAVTPVDHREHLGQQRFAAAPQIGHHVARPAARARSAAASGAPGPPADSRPAARSVPFRSTGSRYPTSVVGPRAPPAAAPRPTCPCRNGKSSGCARHAGHGDRASSPSAAGSKNTADPVVRSRPAAPGRAPHPAATTYTRPDRGHVPERREIVDVTTTLADIRRGPRPMHRHREACPDRSGIGRWAHRRGG